ncbi:MAG: L-2-amino-thiazoline-4-carboxylic acid hydrolase [Pseudomonadota bacterium]
MTLEEKQQQLVDAIKARGKIYLAAFREVKQRYGEAEAISVMRAASRAVGEAEGQGLSCFAPRDFAGMAEAFAKAPDDGTTYQADIRQLDETCLEVQMMACPLRDSWIEAGCSDEEVCTLLYCASAFDEATLETAGFDYELELWTPGQVGCCRTRITEKAGG